MNAAIRSPVDNPETQARFARMGGVAADFAKWRGVIQREGPQLNDS